jgi:hypothetical protein
MPIHEFLYDRTESCSILDFESLPQEMSSRDKKNIKQAIKNNCSLVLLYCG